MSPLLLQCLQFSGPWIRGQVLKAIKLVIVSFLERYHLSLHLISSFLPFLPHPLGPSVFFSIILSLPFILSFLSTSANGSYCFCICKFPSGSTQPAWLTFHFPSSFSVPFQFLPQKTRRLCAQWDWIKSTRSLMVQPPFNSTPFQ